MRRKELAKHIIQRPKSPSQITLTSPKIAGFSGFGGYGFRGKGHLLIL